MDCKKKETPLRQGFAGSCLTAFYYLKQLYGAQGETRTSTVADTTTGTWVFDNSITSGMSLARKKDTFLRTYR